MTKAAAEVEQHYRLVLLLLVGLWINGEKAPRGNLWVKYIGPSLSSVSAEVTLAPCQRSLVKPLNNSHSSAVLYMPNGWHSYSQVGGLSLKPQV